MSNTPLTLIDPAWREVLVSYNRRDLLVYALGIGATDLCFAYEDDADFAAFPTYPVVLGFKGDAADVVPFPSPAMMQMALPVLPGTHTVLDGERYIEMLAPVPADGASLTLRTRLVGVHAKGKGALLSTESELRDASNTLLYRMHAGTYAVGAAGFRDEGRALSVVVPVPARAADAVHAEKVAEQQAQLYRLSGDCAHSHPHPRPRPRPHHHPHPRRQRAARQSGDRRALRLRRAHPARAVHPRLRHACRARHVCRRRGGPLPLGARALRGDGDAGRHATHLDVARRAARHLCDRGHARRRR